MRPSPSLAAGCIAILLLANPMGSRSLGGVEPASWSSLGLQTLHSGQFLGITSSSRINVVDEYLPLMWLLRADVIWLVVTAPM